MNKYIIKKEKNITKNTKTMLPCYQSGDVVVAAAVVVVVVGCGAGRSGCTLPQAAHRRCG